MSVIQWEVINLKAYQKYFLYFVISSTFGGVVCILYYFCTSFIQFYFEDKLFYKQGEVLDEAGLKRLILLLEKRVLKNQELRIKFPDGPDKFMESEVELHQTIQVLLN